MAETFVEKTSDVVRQSDVGGDARSFIVQSSELTKRYGEFTAVDHLNLRVREGEIFGLLGPNGAGKTTTILMILGLTEPTLGTVQVCGHNSTRDPLKVKSLVGYLPENVGFYEDLTARQNLRYTARLNGLSDKEAEVKITESLDQVGLSDAADKNAGHFSRGMRQRLGIADVLIKSPKLVILDEPTLGLDPDGVNQLLDLIVRMSRQQNMTIMLSSHQLEQVQQICDRICIFVKGRIVAEGRIEDLGTRALAGKQLTTEVQVARMSEEFIAALRRLEGVSGVERSGDLALVRSERDLREPINGLAVKFATPLLHLRMRGYGLEEIYFKYFREG
ncbi:MAG: ABC transporter ATP-binding protein [Chloroflexi bacterium]|nr:ABC transporter ATP-binding protein [Chloroflexota bacterium]